MYAFVVLLGLVLALTVVMQVLDEVLPVKAPAALSRTVGVVLAIGLARAIDWSVFTAFAQELRADWMHPVATGLVLIGGGEFLRSVVAALAHRAGEPPVEAAPVAKMRAA
jgi:hypothetical protein